MKKKINKKFKNPVRDLSKIMIMDRTKVMSLIPIPDDFEDDGKLKLDVLGDYWKSAEFVLSNWDNVLMDINADELYCERTTLAKSLVDNFVKTVNAFFEEKIKMKHLSLYENKIKDCPCIMVYANMGCIIAPRVHDDDKRVFEYEDYKDEPKPKKDN